MMTCVQRALFGGGIGPHCVAFLGSLLFHGMVFSLVPVGLDEEQIASHDPYAVELTVASLPPSSFASLGKERRDDDGEVLPGTEVSTVKQFNIPRRKRRRVRARTKRDVSSPAIFDGSKEAQGDRAGRSLVHAGTGLEQAGPPVSVKEVVVEPMGEEVAVQPPRQGGPYDRRTPLLPQMKRHRSHQIQSDVVNPSISRDKARSSPRSIRIEQGIPEPGSGHAEFDFYSPFDFKKEMAKARKKDKGDRMTHNIHKNTDRGYGVVCNIAGGWFLCAEKGLNTCNRKYDNLCRYAEKSEAKTLAEDIIF